MNAPTLRAQFEGAVTTMQEYMVQNTKLTEEKKTLTKKIAELQERVEELMTKVNEAATRADTSEAKFNEQTHSLCELQKDNLDLKAAGELLKQEVEKSNALIAQLQESLPQLYKSHADEVRAYQEKLETGNKLTQNFSHNFQQLVKRQQLETVELQTKFDAEVNKNMALRDTIKGKDDEIAQLKTTMQKIGGKIHRQSGRKTPCKVISSYNLRSREINPQHK